MKKKAAICIIMTMAMVSLSACDGMTIPDMTQQQETLVAEYAAGLLMKYDPLFDNTLMTDDQLAKASEKERIQIFEGTVIAKKHGGISETFTVRRVAHGCGIERVFPLHSPVVDKVEVVRYGKVRRAKLYYLRDRVGKAAKVKEQIR